MAAGFTPTFGDGDGQFCAEACQHTDCAAARELAAASCCICGAAIGDESRFFKAQDGDGYEHASCVYQQQDERERDTRVRMASR